MSKARPYFALHQIDTGLYTRGKEYYSKDGVEYIGPYHKLPNGMIFTGFVPTDRSTELFLLSNQIVASTEYRTLTKIATGKYIEPIYSAPRPSDDDYSNGFIFRYFVQKRNDPAGSIIEIDKEQYDGINRSNGPGINENVWRKLTIAWYIRGDGNSVAALNSNTLHKAAVNFYGLIQYVKNTIEFLK